MTDRDIIRREAESFRDVLGGFFLRETPVASGPAVHILGGYAHLYWFLESVWRSYMPRGARDFSTSLMRQVFRAVHERIPEKKLHQLFYRRHCNDLRRRGWNANISQVGVSPRHIYETVSLVREEIEALYGDERVTLLGHSLGGVVAIALLIFHPEMVKHVVVIGTPVLDTPLRSLMQVVKLHTGASKEMYFSHQKEILERSDRITVVSSAHDSVAPSTRCRIEGVDGIKSAAAHVLLERLFPNRRITHTTMLHRPEVFEVIAEVLRGNRRLAAA